MNVIDARTHPPDVRGFARDRLDVLLSQIPRHALTLVTAPPGSGKTTALTQFVALTDHRVAWYTADSLDGRADTFLQYLCHSIDHDGGVLTDGCNSAAELARQIDERLDGELVLVLDDFHLLGGQPAENVVSTLLDQLPRNLHLVIVSRLPPNIDVSALRLTGEVFEIDADDLRFRTWEAELLFADAYDLVLRPDDVARLTRQVGGWAAGLQLFHLAARGKLPAEQRRLIRTASTKSALARQYLTNHVVGALPADLREFLLPTSLLGVVQAELADDLLDRTGSEGALERLERFGWFVNRIDDRTYRYHDVLRSHLESMLAEQIPRDELTSRYIRAAELLEGAGFLGDAIRCRVRAGQTHEVGRLVSRACREPTHAPGSWLDLVDDDTTRGGDPWISLARARDEVGSGRFRRASVLYRRAEELFGESDQAVTCQHERTALDSFCDPLDPSPEGWLGEFRDGLIRNPVGASRELARRDDPSALVASGALLFLVGHFDGAADKFDAALLGDEVPDWAVDVGRLGHQLVRLVSGPTDPAATLAVIDRLTGNLDRHWCRRVSDAIVAMTTGAGGTQDAATISQRCLDNGDPLGAAFCALCAGVSARGPESVEHFRTALRLADEQRSWLLAAWAHGGLARSVRGDERVAHAAEAMRLSRKMGLSRVPIDAFWDLSREPTVESERSEHELPPVVRCFGDLRIDGADKAIEALRPRAREVLMRLAMQIGHPVHRDRLVADLWPDTPETSAVRNLQVAISSIRRTLAGGVIGVDRCDNSYVLTEPESGRCDLVEYSRLCAQSNDVGDDVDDRVAAARQALDLHHDDLLVGAGAADWVVDERARLRRTSASVALHTAHLALEHGRIDQAVDLARRGLEHDRYDDGLWRVAIESQRALGADGAAEHLRMEYHAVLRELGVDELVEPADV